MLGASHWARQEVRPPRLWGEVHLGVTWGQILLVPWVRGHRSSPSCSACWRTSWRPGAGSATSATPCPRWPPRVLGVERQRFGTGTVSGRIAAPGGPYLYDSQGRVVFFHGVDAVYKHAPYELYPDPGKPWNFSTADASLMARLGFNVVRLGMTWSGLEPGTAPANDPAICGRREADRTRTSSTGRCSTATWRA